MKPRAPGQAKFYGGSSKSHAWCQNLLWQKHVVKERKQLQSDATARHMRSFRRNEAKKVWSDTYLDTTPPGAEGKRAEETPPRTAQSRASGMSWGSETSSQAGLAAHMCVRSPKFHAALERSARDAMRGQVGRDIDELKRAVSSAAEEQFFTNLKLDKLTEMIAAIPPPKVEEVKVVVKKKKRKKKKSEYPPVKVLRNVCCTATATIMMDSHFSALRSL